jgi:hypothetical protein
MEFSKKRRQQFLGEANSTKAFAFLDDSIATFSKQPTGIGNTEAERWMYAHETVALDKFNLLCLKYTAGEDVEPLRQELEDVVAAFEKYGHAIWQLTKDRNETVFVFTTLDEYCQLLQLIGLCFLLHRRDLLPRIAALQDGVEGHNGGADTLFEEFMIHAVGADKRYESDYGCQLRPYENLFYGLTEDTPVKQIKEIDLFLKHWYKDLAGTGWHDSHKPDEAGNQNGYYGYWSFEAGAAVLLLGIEDDSSLYKYLYYPKDMVAWARANTAMSHAGERAAIDLRAVAGEPCPREGFWVTPAKTGSRRHFKVGDVMPDFKSDYGVTIWQWDSKQ